MAQSTAHRHYLRALTQWPKDALRPDTQFPDAIRRRLERISAAGKPIDEKRELVQVNALYSLVENRYAGKYPLLKILKPTSNPTYYTDLVRELEEAPNRSWVERVVKRVKGALRF